MAQNETPVPHVPTSWPGGFGLYKYSRDAVMVNWAALVLIVIFSVAFGVSTNEFINVRVGSLTNTLLGPLTTTFTTILLLDGVQGRKRPFTDGLNASLPFYIRMFLLNILVALTYVASIVCFVVPFFFVFPRLILAPALLIDKDLGVMEAYKTSWALTRGHAGKVLGIAGAILAMALLSLTIIGIPFAVYFLFMYNAAYVILYKYIDTSPTKPAVPAA